MSEENFNEVKNINFYFKYDIILINLLINII